MPDPPVTTLRLAAVLAFFFVIGAATLLAGMGGAIHFEFLGR